MERYTYWITNGLYAIRSWGSPRIAWIVAVECENAPSKTMNENAEKRKEFGTVWRILLSHRPGKKRRILREWKHTTTRAKLETAPQGAQSQNCLKWYLKVTTKYGVPSFLFRFHIKLNVFLSFPSDLSNESYWHPETGKARNVDFQRPRVVQTFRQEEPCWYCRGL